MKGHMNPILEMLMNAGGGGAVQQLSRQFGLSEDQTQGALGQLVPAVMAGLQQNTATEGGLGSLIGALTSGNHSQYLDNPELLGQESTVAEGNGILGHIFGSKEVSRSVAGNAARQTGIGTDVMKQMLPIVATMVMGSLSRNTAAAGSESRGSFLTSLLDQNRSGGIGDEVVGLLGRFLGGR
jgi:hypothetical protein